MSFTPKQLGPQSQEGHERAKANLVAGGHQLHGAWGLWRRHEVPRLPWAQDGEREAIQEALEQYRSELVARCGGDDDLLPEAASLIEGIVVCRGCAQLILRWAETQEALLHGKNGMIRKAVRQDWPFFQDREQRMLRDLERHYVANKNSAIPSTPAEWIEQHKQETDT